MVAHQYRRSQLGGPIANSRRDDPSFDIALDSGSCDQHADAEIPLEEAMCKSRVSQYLCMLLTMSQTIPSSPQSPKLDHQQTDSIRRSTLPSASLRIQAGLMTCDVE